MTAQHDKAVAFRALHRRDSAFIIPNPWDLGAARLFEQLGFEALATTSSGFAQTQGRLDQGLSREQVLAHCRALCQSSPLPISADLENGFGDDPTTVAETIALGAAAGLVGGSIEDYCPDDGGRIYSLDHAVERVHAAVEAARTLDVPFTLTARAENLIRGVLDIDDCIRRLQAFEAVGADVLYAPGLATLDQVQLVADAVTAPLNVLATPLHHCSVAELAAHGAKRISIGGSLARVVLATMLDAAREMLSSGTFRWAEHMASRDDIERVLGPRS